MLRIWLSFAQEMLSQRDALFYWIPVFIAVGIGIFFSLSFEPSIFSLTFCAVLGMGLWAVGLFFDTVVRSIIWAVALIFAGFVVAGLRAHMVHAPTLGYRYYGEIEGRVIGIDRSASGALRITLDQVQLGKISKPRTPARIRLSLHGPPPEREPRIGDKLLTKGSVVPPQGPAEPGGFDFRRQAYFQGLGGVGYTRKAVELQNSDVTPLPLWFAKLRGTLSSWIKAELSQPVAGFAAAIMTGDRSGLEPSLVKDLTRTNLAHLLAISGLHMGLSVSVMLLAARTLCLLLPVFFTRLYAKKIAAFVALCTAAVYLGLSGGSISTQRAFVMVAVMLVAVLFDRRAISLRSVALAAAILLLLRPEALFSPRFSDVFRSNHRACCGFSVVEGLSISKQAQGGKLGFRCFFIVLCCWNCDSALCGLSLQPLFPCQPSGKYAECAFDGHIGYALCGFELCSYAFRVRGVWAFWGAPWIGMDRKSRALFFWVLQCHVRNCDTSTMGPAGTKPLCAGPFYLAWKV